MLTCRAARVGVSTSVGAIYGYEVLIGLGTGVYTQASFAVAQAVVAPADAPSSLTLMLVGTSSRICGHEHLV